MKSLLFILSLACISTQVIAQEGEKKVDQRISVQSKAKGGVEVRVETRDSIPVNAKDTTIITTKNKTIYIVNENDGTHGDSLYFNCEKDSLSTKAQLSHWAGIDLGVNGFVSPDGDLDIGDENAHLEVDYAKSRSISFNFLEYKVRLVKDHVGLLTGAGLQYNSYRLKNDYTLSAQKDSLVAFMDSSISISKNKLRTTWLNVPLLLEFNTSLDHERSFHVAGGVIGGVHLGSMFKQKSSSEGTDFKQKSKNEFHVAPYKLEATVRVGYAGFTLFANYQLTELFEEGHGPELYPFTLGLTLVNF